MSFEKNGRGFIQLCTFWIPYRPLRLYIRETLKCLFLDNTMSFFDLIRPLSKPLVRFDSSRKTLLLIDGQIPTFDRDTGSRVTYQYLRFFSKNRYNIIFLPKKTFPRGRYLKALYDADIPVVFDDPVSFFQKHGKNIDFIYLNRPDVAEHFLPVIKKHSTAKIIYQAHDLHYLRLYRTYEQNRDETALKESEKMKVLEYDIARKTDAFCSFSDYEISLIKQAVPGIRTFTVPLYLWKDVPSRTYRAEERHGLIFVSNFKHIPNVDALNWFLQEIFPKVMAKIADIKLYIVGANPPDDLLALSSKNIIFKGFLPDCDLKALMSKVRLNVVPLRFGAGVKGKIIESVYAGVPVLTTPIGVEGIAGTKMITVCDGTDFADGLVELYTDFGRLNNASETAPDFICQHYSYTAAANIFKRIEAAL